MITNNNDDEQEHINFRKKIVILGLVKTFLWSKTLKEIKSSGMKGMTAY